MIEDVYEAFLPINDQVKQIVTDWQLREVDGTAGPQRPPGPCPRRRVSSTGCTTLDAEVAAALASLSRGAPTLRRLLPPARSGRSPQIDAGDTTMVAAPIKDSYHTVWFELHEELLVLSGRQRTE